jgi:hypothetical protein
MVTKQSCGFKNHLWKTLYDIMHTEALTTNTETNYSVWNQCDMFICLDLMVNNRDIYFNQWISTKLVSTRYQNY